MKTLLKTLVLVFLSLGLVMCAFPANADGSDAPIPYTVDDTGVTLPDGVVFPAHGHVNWRTTLKAGGVHFDPNNDQTGAVYIGQAFLPIPLEPGECIFWVQVSLYNEHFGEGGQEPVCKPNLEEPSEPEPEEPSPTVETPEPSVEPTPVPTSTPEPEPSTIPAPSPTLDPSPEPTVETVTSTPEAPTPPANPDSATSSGRTDPPTENDTDVVEIREESTPVAETPVLAETGVHAGEIFTALLLITVGVLVVHSRRWLDGR